MLNIPKDDILWIGRPSHLTKILTYFCCLAVFLFGLYLMGNVSFILQDWPEYIEIAEIVFLVLPVLAALTAVWTALNIYYTRWILTEETLFSRQNFLAGDYDTIWLHVVRDVAASKPLIWRMFGLGYVNLVTMDRTHKKMKIGLIKEADFLKLKLNEMARKSALDHGTRVVDWGR